MSPPSSPRSGADLVLERRRSVVALGLYVLGLTVLAAAAVLVAGPAYVKTLAVAGVLAYALAGRPRRGPVLVCQADGRWALPARGLRDLVLDPGTRYTRAWARLRLVDSRGRAHAELVWADELRRDEWRRLGLLLREPAQARRDLRAGGGTGVGRPDAR